MPRVLLIDDDDVVRGMTHAMLTGGGHDVRDSASARQALAVIDSWKPDVVVLDVLMPDMDGLEFLGLLRQRAVGRPKVVAISGGGRIGQTELLQVARVLGATCTLPKPFLQADLLAAVDRVLGVAS